MRRALPILCLLLAACDREQSANYDESRSSKSSARAASRSGGSPDRRADLTPEEAAAARDPELQRLLDACQAAALTVCQVGEKNVAYEAIRQELAEYYAAHHPVAGLAWMRQYGNDYQNPYPEALYRVNPEAVIQAVKEPKDELQRNQIIWHVAGLATPADRERMWQILLAQGETFPDDGIIKQQLNGIMATSDPEASWERWQLMNGPKDVAGYLLSIRPLNPGVAYPLHLLDLVPEKDRPYTLIYAFQTAGDTAPLEAWLAGQPVDAHYNRLYRDIGKQHEGEEAAAWYERITDDDFKRFAILHAHDPGDVELPPQQTMPR